LDLAQKGNYFNLQIPSDSFSHFRTWLSQIFTLKSKQNFGKGATAVYEKELKRCKTINLRLLHRN